MPIGFDSSGGWSTSQVSPVTLSFNNVGGNLLVVGVRTNQSSDTTTACTYNSVDMTKVDGQAGNANISSVAMFYLVSPATGTNTVSCSLSSGEASIAALSYTGATGGLDANTKQLVTSVTSITTTLTTNTDNDWTVLMCGEGDGANIAAGAGLTSRVATGNYIFGDSNAAITPAGSTSMAFSWGNPNDGLSVMAAFKPTAVVVARLNLLLMGAG